MTEAAMDLRDRLDMVLLDDRNAVRVEAEGNSDTVCQRFAQAIVSELGITPEMVEVVGEMARDCLGDCGDHEYAGHGLGAADALSTLLEVAGVQTEVNDES